MRAGDSCDVTGAAGFPAPHPAAVRRGRDPGSSPRPRRVAYLPSGSANGARGSSRNGSVAVRMAVLDGGEARDVRLGVVDVALEAARRAHQVLASELGGRGPA